MSKVQTMLSTGPPQSTLRRLQGGDLCVFLGGQERPMPQGERTPGQVPRQVGVRSARFSISC